MTKLDALIYFKRRQAMYIHDRIQEAENIAIECIEKQIPRKPIDVYKSWDSGYVKGWSCPNCGKRHSAEYRLSCANDICEECHQLIDWSDNE